MTKNKHKTKVSFLKDRKNRWGVFAYFPDEIYNVFLYGKSQKVCYMHVGQHSSCHVNYARGCKKATPCEYNNLKLELENIGYNLTVLK